MASIVYCTREDVKRALDSAETARDNAQIDRVIGSGARRVDGLLKRSFRPVLATRYFDWPNSSHARPWRLWLNGDQLISLTTLTVGGTVIASSDYFLEPVNSGPPYNRIEIDLGSSAAFSSASTGTHQRAIEALGLWGYENDEEGVGSLAANLGSSSTSTASITWTTAGIGVGDVLRIDSERMIVTDMSMVDSTQNLGANLTAATSNVTVQVTTGSGFDVGEVILIDSERMLVVDIAGNNLTVRRGWDGSVLAAHTAGADIYALTGVELQRGALGTTAAAHASGATISRHIVPELIRDLNVGEALVALQNERSAYARTAGSGDNEILVGGRGLVDIRRDAVAAYGRRARKRAI